MKIKNKGKVYPSPSSSFSSSSDGDYLSVLKILPAAILALASVLSLEDREVLAYLITRSINTTTSTPNLSSPIVQKKSAKKTAKGINNLSNTIHKPPVFGCDCFDCYRSYWFRWDSSPDRELIHQAIEAFEDRLTNGETEKSKKNGKGKRRDNTTRRYADNKQVVELPSQPDASVHGKQVEEETLESSSSPTVVISETLPENCVSLVPVSSPEKDDSLFEENDVVKVSGESSAVGDEETWAIIRSTTAASGCTHKGLARKVLPDVLGLFNSRLWSLWSPDV